MDNKNWLYFNRFSNLIDVNLEKGTFMPIIDYERKLNVCKNNCDFFNKKDYDICIQDCKNSIDLEIKSIDFAKNKCPNGDFKCCKNAAKDNDFAYLYCINQKNFDYKFRISKKAFIAILITLILFLIFLFFVFSK